jgi:hypothetical protein
MAITLRYTGTDTGGKTSELTYQEMNDNLKSYYYSSSLSGSTLQMYTTGSVSHSIDLSSFLDNTNTNIYNTDGTLTGNRTVAGDGSSLTFDFQSANFTIQTAEEQSVTITGLPQANSAQILGIDGSGNLSLMLTSSIPGQGGTDTNLYNTNGTLTAARTVTANANNLTFSFADANFTIGSGGGTGGDVIISDLRQASTDSMMMINAGTGVVSWMATSSLGLGGSTSPGGSDTQVQFNDSGNFGGDSGLTYNKTSNRLTITAPSSPTRTAPNLLLNSELANVTAGEVFGVIAANNATDQYNPASYPASIQFVADTNFAPGNYDARIGLFVNNNATETEALRLKSSGQASLPQYGSGTFTGTNAYYLAVSASGEVIETAPPGGFTRPGSDTSITYDTYLQTINTYSVNAVGTSPAAPSSNGDVSIRYAVSNIGSNVDRIDVYDSDGTDRSATLLNLAISGSITIAQVGAGAHTEVYRIISVTDNTSYVSYAVSWVSGDDAAMSTITTDTFTFNADYEYTLSTGYNRLLVTNNSNSAANQFRLAPPAGASAGDEVIVELKINTSGVNVRPTYYVRTGTPTFMIANRVSQIDGGTITGMELDTNDIAIMRFQVNDIGSIEGLMLLGAVQMVNA